MMTNAAANGRKRIHFEQNVKGALIITSAQTLHIFARVGMNRAGSGACGHHFLA
jgi:hypothetical protein